MRPAQIIARQHAVVDPIDRRFSMRRHTASSNPILNIRLPEEESGNRLLYL